jgi:hypothetical protein
VEVTVPPAPIVTVYVTPEMIGNAVPPRFAKIIADTILEIFEHETEDLTIKTGLFNKQVYSTVGFEKYHCGWKFYWWRCSNKNCE